MVQLAWALNDLQSLAGNLEANERNEKPKHDVHGYVDRVERLVKSAADVMATALGDDYEPVRAIVETYARLGEGDQNWLLRIDEWAELDKQGVSAGSRYLSAEWPLSTSWTRQSQTCEQSTQR